MLSPAERTIVALSLKVGGVAMAAVLPLAFALAWLLARGRFPGKLLLAFGPNGPLGSLLERWFGVTVLFRWTGAAIAAAIMALPLMVRAMRLSIEAVDRRLESAARTLGAGPWRVFWTLTLPLSLPGILAGAVLGFARSIGEFGATITFVSNVPGETQTLPLAIYSALQQPGAEATVWRLSAMSVALSLAALLISELLTRRVRRGLHVL